MNKRNVIITIVSVLILTCIFAFARTTTTDLILVKPTWLENIDILDDLNANSDLLEAFANDPLEFDSDLERLEDRVGAMFSGNTETGLSLTYQDADNTIDVVIGANDIVEFMLKAVNAPLDEEVFTYESTTGDFEWHTLAELSIQPLDAGLTSIAGLSTEADKMIYTTASDVYATATLTAFARTVIDDAAATNVRDTLGLTIGTNVEAHDDGLLSIAGLTTAANKSIYTTALDVYAVYDLTAFGRSIVDDADASGVRTTLGLVYGTNVQAYDDGLLSLAGLTYASDSFIKVTATDVYAIRTIAEVKTDLSLNNVTNDAQVAKSIGTAQGDLIYFTGSATPTVLAKGAATEVLTMNAGATAPEWAAAGGGYTNLTSFVEQTAWRVFYSNTNGDVVELALGADGTYLKSNGAAAAPTFSTPAGAGDVVKVGTPVDSQVGVWTGDGTIEGHTSMTYDRSNLQFTGDLGSTGTRITKAWLTDLEVTNAISGVGMVSASNADITIQPNGTGDTRIYAPSDVVTSKSGVATLTVAEAGTLLVSAAAAYTLTLPTASGHSGLRYHFVKTDANYNLITLDGNGAETFNYENSTGAPVATYARLNTYCAEVTIVSDGTNWQVINEALGQNPKAYAYLSADQLDLHQGYWNYVELDTEGYDIGSNFDTSEWISGNADGTVAGHLQDDGASQFTTAMLYKRVKNTTDSTYAYIIAFNDAGDVTLNLDIFVNGEGYQIMKSRYVCPLSGTYLVTASVGWTTASMVTDKRYITGISKNGTNIRAKCEHASIAQTIYPSFTIQEKFSKDDYINMESLTTAAVSSCDLASSTVCTFFQITLLEKD